MSSLHRWSVLGLLAFLAGTGPGLQKAAGQAATADNPPPADIVPFEGLSPLEAAEKATLPPGFKLHLFAGEPDVRQPIAFCDDDRGRLWVVEGYTYPKRAPEGQGKDRILVFEDTDGDHRFDRRTVFMEGLNLVSGIEYGFGGLWIGAAPHLLFIPVTEGDVPKPAGPPQVLLDGWDYQRDTHETLNTFTWGPDGWLYGCHGVFCPSHVGKPGAPESERQWVDAASWRYHPVRHKLEVFAEGGSNPWGIDFDEYGELWSEMCVIPHLFHMIQGARVTRQGGEHYCIDAAEAARNARHRDPRSRKPVFPYVYEDITTHADHLHYAGSKGPHAANGRSDSAGGGHAHAGMLVYQGVSWPESFRGGLIMGNIHGQRLNMDRTERQGSGWVGRHATDLLNFNDRWSQTLNQRTDPDGSVYVIDWYDKNQCHHNNFDGHDRSNGRIFKIVYNNQAASRVNLAGLGDEDLAGLAGSRNEWLSRHARRLLQERAERIGPDAVERLRHLAFHGSETPARLRGLWALHLCGHFSHEDAVRLLDDPDEYVRGWVIQLKAERAQEILAAGGSEKASKAIDRLAQMAREDRSPLVRRFLASATQRIPPAQRWNILTGLASHAEDATDHNLPLLYWYAAEGAVAEDPGRGLDLLRTARIPKLRELIARRIAQAGLVSSKP